MADRQENDLDILFLIGCWEGESKRYRVYNLVEGLDSWGYRTNTLDYSDCGRIVDEGMRPAAIVFFRSPFDPGKRIVEVLEYCRVNHIKTIFDIDDYVFEPAIIDDIAGVAYLDEKQRADYEWGVRAYRSLAFCCEHVTTTTDYLATKMRELGRDVTVVPNTVNLAQRALAETLLQQRERDDQTVRICYFSGSKTHARDFAECAEAVQATLRKYPQVVFRLVGLLDLDDSWVPFAERIERFGFMSPLDMLANMAEGDINLAPLEEGNSFCEGKSELKFFEAGLVEVPTVASRSVTYKAAIDDGKTGFLASDVKEWSDKLARLVESSSLRAQIGKNARSKALSAFSTDTAARRALVAYGLEKAAPVRLETSKTRLKIGWIVPGLIIGGGGHRNILRAAYHLERFGHDVRLYFSDTNMSEAELRRTVRQHFYPFEGPVSRFGARADREDVMMATHWSTVALAESVKSEVGEIMYFVQDSEPAFYPMGSEYILAENTYRKNLYAITSGPWCAHILTRDYGMEADSFRFPVDSGVYNREAGGDLPRKKRVLFFAKPEMDRRCFMIGAMALREFHRLKPDYELLFFGSGNARKHGQDYPVTYLDIVPTINDLATLYATSAAGLVFSTTNPSLVPYEMMACGLPVVDLDRPGNEVNYDGRRDIALLADADPTRMAQNIVSLLENDTELALRSGNGLEFAATFPSEEEMARRVEKLIVSRIEERSKKKLLA